MLNMTDKYYNRLLQLQQDNPQLTFQNDGYQYLSKEIVENHKLQIAEISEILKTTVKGFEKFNNFRIRKNGDIVVRLQFQWSSSFTGVGYFELEDFKNFEEDEN